VVVVVVVGGGRGGGGWVQICSLEIQMKDLVINPLINAELNPICHLLALLAHNIFNVSGLRVNRKLIFRWILKEYVLRVGISFIVVVIGFGVERCWDL